MDDGTGKNRLVTESECAACGGRFVGESCCHCAIVAHGEGIGSQREQAERAMRALRDAARATPVLQIAVDRVSQYVRVLEEEGSRQEAALNLWRDLAMEAPTLYESTLRYNLRVVDSLARAALDGGAR